MSKMSYFALICFLFIGVFLTEAGAWTGKVCPRTVCSYRYRRVCRYRFWGSCCSWKTIREPYYNQQNECCFGYRHNGNQNCNIPVCNPSCQNGGACSSPGKCTCPSTHTGDRCTTAVCSYNSPCFPGTCHQGDSCDCDSGFRTATPVDKQNYCLKIEGQNADLNVTAMQVRLSYWPRHASTPMEQHWIMADSTQQNEMDVFWTNRRDFNRLETTCGSQYLPPRHSDPPDYVTQYGFGIVDGKVEVWLKKLNPYGREGSFTSLNHTINCAQGISRTAPETNLYNCSVINRNFDRLLEHRDALKITFSTDGGGFRRLTNLRVQNYESVRRTVSVEFRFDFVPPSHCAENRSCSAGQSMLDVPDSTTSKTVIIRWSGWEDEDSDIHRYAWEVFKMRKISNNELEIEPSRVLQPLQPPVEVLADRLKEQQFELPERGMYSVILEVGDLANNTKFVRRLVFYDPNPTITSDPRRKFFVASAAEAADYRYQNNISRPVEVKWEGHFRNAFHEDYALLGAVRPYPKELSDGTTADGKVFYRKDIAVNTPLEDYDGKRTVEAIPNKRGIVNFKIQYARDSDGGLNQPEVPRRSWTDLGLNTTFFLPSTESLGLGDTVTVWLKATDFFGKEQVERTRVSFDSTPPEVSGNLRFHMNVPVEGIDFSSTFDLETRDEESGIAYILWKFTRKSSGDVIYQQKVNGRTEAYPCQNFQTCSCTKSRECFAVRQPFHVSNCHMMVEKENLDREVILVTADITNMAGLFTRLNMTKDDLTKLNGTEAYYPPQNISVKSISQDSVTITWNFPPSCFNRTALWIIVNGEKMPVHKDAVEYSVSGLTPATTYTVYLVTDYVGNEQSDQAPVMFTTGDADGLGAGAVAGIVIGILILLLLILLIAIFILWRRGVIFQKETSPVNRQLHRVSRAFTQVRKTIKGERGVFSVRMITAASL